MAKRRKVDTTEEKNVPYDVWVEILKHLSIKELAVVARACKLFYEISRDGNLWRHLHQQHFQRLEFVSRDDTKGLLRRMDRPSIKPCMGIDRPNCKIFGSLFLDVFACFTPADWLFECCDINDMTLVHQLPTDEKLSYFCLDRDTYLSCSDFEICWKTVSGDILNVYKTNRPIDWYSIDGKSRYLHICCGTYHGYVFPLVQYKKPALLYQYESMDLQRTPKISSEGKLLMLRKTAGECYLSEVDIQSGQELKLQLPQPNEIIYPAASVRTYGRVRDMKYLPSGLFGLHFTNALTIGDVRTGLSSVIQCPVGNDCVSISPHERIFSVQIGNATQFWDLRRPYGPVSTLAGVVGQYIGTKGYWLSNDMVNYDCI